MASDDRQKALERAMKQITKDYGKGSIMRLGDETNIRSAMRLIAPLLP